MRSSSGGPAQGLADSSWALVAAPRAALLAALPADDAWFGVESAVLSLAAEGPAVVLPGGSFVEPGAKHAWTTAVVESGAMSPPLLSEPPGPGERFVLFDPAQPATTATIVSHGRRGASASPLAIGVGVRSGISVEQAFAAIVGALRSGGVDLDRSPDMRILERPLWTIEVGSLEEAQSSGLRATA